MNRKSTKKNLDIWNDYHYEKKNPIQLSNTCILYFHHTNH